MKNSYLIFLLILSIFSCTPEEEPIIEDESPILMSTWQLIETLFDPGDGSGTFTPIDSDKIIRLWDDGSIQANGAFCPLEVDPTSEFVEVGTYSTANETFTINDCNGIEQEMMYKIEASILRVYFPCIEPCAWKFQLIE